VTQIAVTVNGTRREADVEPRTLLVYFLREQLGLTGTNVGCDTSSCGACTVHLDGESVKSCTLLAVQAAARSRRSKRWPGRTGPCTRCRMRSIVTTDSNVGTARRAC